MPQADGSIIIDTKIRKDGYEAGAKDLESACKRTAQKVRGIGDAAKISIEKSLSSISKAQQKVSDLDNQIEKLKANIKSAKETPVKTEGFAALEKEIQKTEAALAKVDEKKRRFMETGGDETSKAFQRMLYDGEQLDIQLDHLISKKRDMESAGTAYTTADTTQMEEQLNSLIERRAQIVRDLGLSYDSVNQKMDQLSQKEQESAAEAARLREIGENAKISNQHIVDLTNRIEELKARQAELSAAGVGFGYAEYGQNAAELARLNAELEKYQKNVTDGEKKTGIFSRAINALGDKAKESASKFLHLGKSSSGVGDNLSQSFSKGLKSLLRYGLGIRSLFVLFNKIRSAAKEGLDNMVQFSGGTNAAMSSMMSALTQLKNSLGAAFAPIIETVAPMISSFIQMLADAINSVNAFISSLLGRSTYTKAIAVQQDYAKSLNKTASAASNAGKATKEAAKEAEGFLAGFDEIQKLNKEAESSGGSGSGSGSGSGGGGASGLTPSMMFETAQIDGIISDWAEMFKDAWENADFTEIGGIIGGKIRDALDSIPWDSIKEKTNKVAKSTATLLNGIFETPGLSVSIGNTVAEMFNTAFGTVNTFLENFHFDSFGAFISSGIQSAFNRFDWGEATRLVSNVIKGIFDFGSGLLEGIDWESLPKDLANAIGEALQGFDFSGMSKSAGKLIGAALLAEVDFAKGITELWDDLVSSIADYFDQHISDAEAAGGSVWDGIANGIVEALKNIGTWIKENILVPFIEGFKEAFDIHSPASNPKLLEAAGYVGEGILQGIAEAFNGIASWIDENILTPIANALDFEAMINKLMAYVMGFVDYLEDVKIEWNPFSEDFGITLPEDDLSVYVTARVNELEDDIPKAEKTIDNTSAKITNATDQTKGKATVDATANLNNSTNSLTGTKRPNVATTANLNASTNSLTGRYKPSVASTANLNASTNSLTGKYKPYIYTTAKFNGVTDALTKAQKTISVTAKFTHSSGKFASGGIIQSNGVMKHFASGGVIANGIAQTWNSIPKYASGTSSAHGSLFVAGEAGPEIVGHIGGRTEVLNKSQIAQAVYSAVVAALGQLTGYFSSMTNSLSKIPDAIQQLSNAFPAITVDIPVLATGTIIPPQAIIATEDANSLRRAMEELTDVLKTQQTGSRSDMFNNNDREINITIRNELDGEVIKTNVVKRLWNDANQGKFPIAGLV